MRRFILELRDNFTLSAREGDIYFLEEFMIAAIKVYRQQDKPIPEILRNTLPLVQEARTAIDTGTWEYGEALNLKAELEDYSSKFANIDHRALADAILAVGIDVHEDYKKSRDNKC